MRFIRKLFFLSLFAALLWLGAYTYIHVTDGFSIHQMTSSLPPYPRYEVRLSSQEKAEYQAILNQPFHYIGKGCQFYAFESDDGHYVLKFLKHKHLRPCTWLNSLPLPSPLREKATAKIERRKLRVENLFSSCQLCYEKMPEETGLIFIHLNRTPALEKKLTIIDKLGFKHTIAVDDHEYVLQKRATTVKETFTGLTAAEVREKIQQLVDLVLARCEKGIRDRDRSFVQNVAFVEDQALFIDIGQFYEDSSILTKEEQLKDLEKRLGNLHHWTNRYFPEFISSVEEFRHALPEQ